MLKTGVAMKKQCCCCWQARCYARLAKPPIPGGDVSLRKHDPADLDARIVQADNAFGLKLHRTTRSKIPAAT